MKLSKHEAVHPNVMEKEFGQNTICQTLRDCYHMTDDPDIRLNLRIAVAMAKAMTRKLREYKAGWDKGFWDERTRD